MPLHVLDIVELGSERIRDVYDDDFPICFTFVEEGHYPEDFDLLDLTYVSDLFADLADVKGIVVALGFGLSVLLRGVFPGLYPVTQ